MNKNILKADFDKKTRKRKLETFNGQYIKGKGGIILTTGPEVESHIKDYKHLLFNKSPFIIVENDKQIFYEIMYKVVTLQQYYNIKIDLYCNDFFKMLKLLENKIRPLKYLHFDVTRTATSLVEEGLIENLKWLTQSNIVKNSFYFDITGSCRPDKGKYYILLTEQVIPHIFKKNGYKTEACQKPGWNSYTYLKTYRDGCPMWTALYRFSK